MTSEAVTTEAPPSNRPYALYRLFDSDDCLLYVGVTAHVPGRLNDHRRDKPWWADVATIKVEPFADQQSALDAERAAIQTEHPKHNIVHARVVYPPTPPGHSLIPDGYLGRREAAAHLGIGVQTFDNQRQKSPGFPKPDYLGRTPYWKVTELDQWRAKHPARKKPEPPS